MTDQKGSDTKRTGSSTGAETPQAETAAQESGQNPGSGTGRNSTKTSKSPKPASGKTRSTAGKSDAEASSASSKPSAKSAGKSSAAGSAATEKAAKPAAAKSRSAKPAKTSALIASSDAQPASMQPDAQPDGQLTASATGRKPAAPKAVKSKTGKATAADSEQTETGAAPRKTARSGGRSAQPGTAAKQTRPTADSATVNAVPGAASETAPNVASNISSVATLEATAPNAVPARHTSNQNKGDGRNRRPAAKGVSARGNAPAEHAGQEVAPFAATAGQSPETAAANESPTTAPEAASALEQGSPRSGGSSRGRGRGGRSSQRRAGSTSPAAASDAAKGAGQSITLAEGASPAPAQADFPTSFGDTSPEDIIPQLAGSSDQSSAEDGAQQEGEGTSTGERKRRSRSRRGRGRKKNAAQNAETAIAANDEEQLQAGSGEDEDRVDGNRGHGASREDYADDGDAPSLRHGVTDQDDADDMDDDDADSAESSDADSRSGRNDRGGRGRGRGNKPADKAEQEEAAVKTGRRKMFVSVQPEEQVEVVLTEEGQVQEYYVEMLHQAKTKGNIYKATIHNVDPNLQAAFVSYGAAKNGFLQIDEVHPEYYNSPHDGKGRKYPPIQKVLKAGQEVLVQVVKEPAGTKGAFLTTYLSLPGRFLVLTPGREQIGVSRKVEQEGERARLRELLEGLSPGPGLGVIVRTVSMGASKTNLQRDLQYLKRTWMDVRTRGTTEKAPSLIYQEMDLTTRAVRDYLTDEVMEVWIDDEQTANSITEIADALFPRKNSLVRVHKDPASTLFERFNLQRQLDQIQSREVMLPSGGRLVIDPTEALTAIDINSGRSGGKNNFEDMAYRTNMEAAKMIPLQLRLRDIGGQVVADFIEMRDRSHWREVEKTLRNGMKVDRARYDVGKIGPFGMLEIVRQRLGSSAISISTEPCPYCSGTGVRRNMEWQSQQALREIQRALRTAQTLNQTEVLYEADPTLAMHLLNNKRQRLLEMEQSYNIRLEIRIKHAEVL